MGRTACRNLADRPALTSVRTRRERVPLSDARQPLRSLRLEGGDVALLTKCDRDLVEAFQKTRPRKLVEREGRPNARRLNGRAFDVDRDGRGRVTARRADELLDRIRIDLDRYEPVSKRVVAENVRESRRDDRAKTGVEKRP